MEERKTPSIPKDAGSNIPRPVEINPHQKFINDVGFNFKERAEFNCICSLGCEQILQCYAYHDEYMCADTTIRLCHGCKYAQNEPASIFWVQQKNKTADREPCFIKDFPEVSLCDDPKSFVYFITDGKFIKIGVAKDVLKRMSALQTSNPKKLKLVCVIPCKSENDAHKLEKKLHSCYARFRTNGEWFSIVDYIDVNLFSDYWNPSEYFPDFDKKEPRFLNVETIGWPDDEVLKKLACALLPEIKKYVSDHMEEFREWELENGCCSV